MLVEVGTAYELRKALLDGSEDDIDLAVPFELVGTAAKLERELAALLSEAELTVDVTRGSSLPARW